jgi:hypothetical protein
MKMKHVVTFKSGTIETYEFKTKTESKKAFKNAKMLNDAFNTIESVVVCPISHPERKYVVKFNPLRVYIKDYTLFYQGEKK